MCPIAFCTSPNPPMNIDQSLMCRYVLITCIYTALLTQQVMGKEEEFVAIMELGGVEVKSEIQMLHNTKSYI